MRKSKVRKSVNPKIVQPESIYDLDALFDSEEKRTKLSSVSIGSVMDPKIVLQTNILSLDLILGGGMRSGRWYEVAGEESCGKSTWLYEACSQALQFIPNTVKGLFVDAEGTLDDVWFSNITGCEDLTEVFGLRDEKTGNWVKTPIIRRYRPAVGEQALKFMKGVLQGMPDKVLVKDTWYYMFIPKTSKAAMKANPESGTRKLQGRLKDKKGNVLYSKELFSKTGNFYVPIPNNYAGPELLMGTDSMASLTPEAKANEDSGALGGNARMFGDHVSTIKSEMSKKGVVHFAINQLREKPMAFGDPRYTPGGNTLKHAVDCRVFGWKVSVPPPGKGQVLQENGEEYRYAKFKTYKNKVFLPHKETLLRWWTGHNGHSGFGCDPVFDTKNYLEMTGQIASVNSKKFKVLLPGFSKYELDKESFKKMVLTSRLRKRCLTQLKNGKGVKLYMNTLE